MHGVFHHHQKNQSLKGQGRKKKRIDDTKNKHTHHVSRLLNFLVTTFPVSMPSLSTILCARSGCDVPLKTLIFGILLCNIPRDFSKFARNKLLARTGWDTGITVYRKKKIMYPWWNKFLYKRVGNLPVHQSTCIHAQSEVTLAGSPPSSAHSPPRFLIGYYYLPPTPPFLFLAFFNFKIIIIIMWRFLFLLFASWWFELSFNNIAIACISSLV